MNQLFHTPSQRLREPEDPGAAHAVISLFEPLERVTDGAR